ncbi:MAG: hypothetical protein KatS3mg105_5128 [Gemmatales bacterium]|nr:MAG: hypothetical protein KatS3mg105_5128 [Gemmatales bacterium]GIW97860.1 MAG: hypothetical protein KatS3mg111_1193 [Pirellulaceae bacterium]
MSVLKPEIARKVDQFIDENHDRWAQLGQKLFLVFKYDEKKGRIATQIRNLQQMACSATRFADIEDFVKNQMGKTGNREWKDVGDEVLSALRELRETSNTLADDTADQMAVRLRLARGWVRTVVSEYLYQVAQTQMRASA